MKHDAGSELYPNEQEQVWSRPALLLLISDLYWSVNLFAWSKDKEDVGINCFVVVKGVTLAFSTCYSRLGHKTLSFLREEQSVSIRGCGEQADVYLL